MPGACRAIALAVITAAGEAARPGHHRAWDTTTQPGATGLVRATVARSHRAIPGSRFLPTSPSAHALDLVRFAARWGAT